MDKSAHGGRTAGDGRADLSIVARVAILSRALTEAIWGVVGLDSGGAVTRCTSSRSASKERLQLAFKRCLPMWHRDIQTRNSTALGEESLG
jgi:hypothetical protein